MRILGLDHIVLRVRDMERMIAFWREALGCTVEKVQAVGGFAVASGSEGHGHAYIALSASVTTDQHEALCRAWGRHLVGRADAKVSDNDLLRPPGTYNRKPTVRGGKPVPVRWLVKP